MTPRELEEARISFGMGRRQFAQQILGYTGSGEHMWTTVKRYETGKRDIPPMLARLVLMLLWFKSDFGYLPDLERGDRVPMDISEDID